MVQFFIERYRHLAESARAFLEGLSSELRAKTHLDYADARRLVWYYYPRVAWQRTGVMVKELEGKQRDRFFQLVRAGTSETGFDTVKNLMQLETILCGRHEADLEPEPRAVI